MKTYDQELGIVTFQLGKEVVSVWLPYPCTRCSKNIADQREISICDKCHRTFCTSCLKQAPCQCNGERVDHTFIG